jgi:hypothetical protein
MAERLASEGCVGQLDVSFNWGNVLLARRVPT